MGITSKQEERALSADEKELVDRSRHPVIKELSDKDLADLVRQLRDKRDRAQTIARQRRREMRGKVAARGAEPSREDEGSRLKSSVLATAVRRANAERERRSQA